MAIFKCKMCGGTLEIDEKQTVAVCEYCSTQQTLPKLDDEKKANLYDRANQFRRNNEYDKAMGLYETILAEDNEDAEAYWSLVLCKYGVEYVEDSITRKRIPTVNRAQYTSVFIDNDYKSAIKFSDVYQRSIYEAEAHAIDEIQKGILAISAKEEPFDIFICYKETDDSGRRTEDSVYAQDIYKSLTDEGYKVFFARITLESVLGSAYEPHIFAALNSAKVMIVIGTKAEYINAPWVKNEWSRYLALIKNDKSKALIPVYKNMDAYDLPTEFAYLQAQDMSKLGFMQDLIRGIKKLISKEEIVNIPKDGAFMNAGVDLLSLLKRAYMFLEDGDFKNADIYCEKILDVNPEFAEAYFVKLLVAFKLRNIDASSDCSDDIAENVNYKRLLRFADDKMKAKVENLRCRLIYESADSILRNANTEYMCYQARSKFESIKMYRDSETKVQLCIEKSNECKQQAELEKKQEQYTKAQKALNIASSIHELDNARNMFAELSGFLDADSKVEECLQAIQNFKNEQIYQSAMRQKRDDTIKAYKAAIDTFSKIKDYKDTEKQIKICEDGIKRIENRIKQNKKSIRKDKNKISIVVFIFVILPILFYLLMLIYATAQ